MNKLNLRVYFILFFILVIVIFSYFLLSSRKTNDNEAINVSFPTPTITPVSQPTLIPPDFTGALVGDIPKEVEDLSQQKRTLRGKVPLTEKAFKIDFDYSEDKFTVILNEPKERSKIEFVNWLKNNYPAIPLDRFIFK
jgi:hypothetical protein